MKTGILKISVCLAILAFVWSDADAQRTPRRRPGGTTPAGTDTTNRQQVNNSNAAPAYNPSINIPITYDTAGADNGAPKRSLRNEDAFEKGGLNTRIPLDYEHLRWDDALFAEKVWRELDLREKMNGVFRYDAQDNSGSQLFIDILLNAIKYDSVIAFNDERFTTPMTIDEVAQQTAGGYDTADKVDINDPSKITSRVVTLKTFDKKSVIKLRIKEEWIFDRESSKMHCRILGLAPVLTKYHENGTERGSTIMFWVHYPDLRASLAKKEVYNPKNMGQNRMTWEELFESRMFSSYILKSTLENPSNRYIRQMYPKDPILALLEGDNVREKIFNYEQDLWSY